VRSLALQIEAARPDLAHDTRQNIAWLREANSKFLAKAHGWFDQTIDRVSERFTLTTRVITFFCAMALVVVSSWILWPWSIGLQRPQAAFRTGAAGDEDEELPARRQLSNDQIDSLSTALIVSIPGSYTE
jgi:hypothetical protein